MLLIEGMNDEEIIALAATRAEIVWQWGCRIMGDEEIEKELADLGLVAHWGEPIRSGDMYLAKRNTGPHLLTCRCLGEACVFPDTTGYAYDFSECVKVTEKE